MTECKRTTIIPNITMNRNGCYYLARVEVAEESGEGVWVKICAPNDEKLMDLRLHLERPVADAIADALRSHSNG